MFSYSGHLRASNSAQSGSNRHAVETPLLHSFSECNVGEWRA